MPIKEFLIGNWIFCHYGEAVNHCIKEDYFLANIKKRERESVAEYEKRTGINYGCAPCSKLGEECKGAKPGAFYYPSGCSSFFNEHEEQERIEQETWEEETCFGLYEEEDLY